MKRISLRDRQFLTRVAMPILGVHRIGIEWSDAKATWPDIWVEGYIITVTREWAKQGMHERRKRLVHELAGHIAFGWPHTPQMEELGFSTYPAKDKVSWDIYRDILSGGVRAPKEYLK